MSKTGDLLKAHRERLAKSQGDLAAAAELSRGVISETESGELPKLTTVVRMREGLGLGRSDWHRLLSTYLVEAGAVDDPEAKDVLSAADRVGKVSSEERARNLHSVLEAIEQMSNEELEIHAVFTQMLLRRPGFYSALSELARMDGASAIARRSPVEGANRSRTSTPPPLPPPSRQPMDPAMKKLKTSKSGSNLS